MNTYTDPKLLDVAGALDVLPQLPLEDGEGEVEQIVKQVVNGNMLPVCVGALTVGTNGKGRSADNGTPRATTLHQTLHRPVIFPGNRYQT